MVNGFPDRTEAGRHVDVDGYELLLHLKIVVGGAQPRVPVF